MQETEIFLYKATDGQVKVNVRYSDQTLWLSQKNMAELFDVKAHTINECLQNVLKNNELDQNSVIRNFRITASDGKNYNTNFFSR